MRAGPPLPLILLLSAGLFAALNWGVHRLSGNSVPRQVLRRVTDRDARTEVLALGNSMIQSGFDPAAFAEGSRRPAASVANGGLGATGPVQHLLIGRAALAAQEQLRVLIYGCHDFMLVEPTRQNWWTLFGNNALVFYREPELAARHLAGNAAERLLFRLVAGVPLFRERGTLWAKVENFRRTLGGWGMPSVAENRFGRANDFNLLVKRDFSAFEQEASAAATDNVSLSGAVRQLLTEARQRNIEVKVVLMPRPADFQPALATAGWQQYVRHLKGLLADQGATLVDASAWATNGVQFMDPLHLNPAGAAAFSRRLGQELSAVR